MVTDRKGRLCSVSVQAGEVKQEFIDQSLLVLAEKQIPATAYCSSASTMAVSDSSVDVIISFYSLEHMHPLEEYLGEFSRILRPGGILVGAIPCEGGLAWGGDS
jgi:ubiquinone/menaquinone biosynthesis C-methylase UbiE